MSTLLGARVNDAGQIILSADRDEAKVFIKEFWNTIEGKEIENYIDTTNKAERNRFFDAVGKVIDRMDAQAGGNAEITMQTFCAIVRTLILTRDPAIFPPEAPAAPDTRARNADGTFRSEFQVFADTHAMTEIRARANSDRAFGDWFRQQVQAQITSPGAYKVLGGTPEHPTTLVDRERLGSFARTYSVTPVDRIRKPINGYVELSDGSRYTPSELRTLVEECSKVGLL